MKQDPPFAVQIEPVEGCTLACSFCALQSIRDNGADAKTGTHGKSSAPYKYMDIATAARVAKSIARQGWNPRIEFAMHGEPTVHPKLPAIIEVFRDTLPKVSLMLTTNGSGIKNMDYIDELFFAGLNTLAYDRYDHAPWKDRALAVLRGYAVHRGRSLLFYPQNKDASPHTRFFGQRIVVIRDISQNISGNHTLTNQGGNSGAADPLEQRCAKPFRELSIRWNGNVAICCDDWKGEYKIGNVQHMPLDAIWQHPRFQAARVALYNAQRSAIGVCSGCNVRTYRNGLLPDKMGRVKLPTLSAADKIEIIEAQEGANYSCK